MTDESKTPDLDALARATIALGEAATPGPWYATDAKYGERESVGLCPLCNEDCPDSGAGKGAWVEWERRLTGTHEDRYTVSRSADAEGWNTDGGHSGYGVCEHDAALIAAYRTSAPALAAALLEARAELARVTAERDKARRDCWSCGAPGADLDETTCRECYERARRDLLAAREAMRGGRTRRLYYVLRYEETAQFLQEPDPTSGYPCPQWWWDLASAKGFDSPDAARAWLADVVAAHPDADYGHAVVARVVPQRITNIESALRSGAGQGEGGGG